jgi:hypothetical protein
MEAAGRFMIRKPQRDLLAPFDAPVISTSRSVSAARAGLAAFGDNAASLP